MWNSITAFLKFLNWGWFVAVIFIAAFAVALYPFEDFSFDYIMRTKVFLVMGKTVLIAAPIVLMVGGVGYAVHKLSLWQKNVLGAIAMHALGGVMIPFAFISWMISLLYSENILANPSHQSDLVFTVFLLIILNFWMRVRILVALDKGKDLKYASSDKDKDLKYASLEQKYTALSAHHERFKESEEIAKQLLVDELKQKDDEVSDWASKCGAIQQEYTQLFYKEEKTSLENELLKAGREELKEFVNNWANSLSSKDEKESKCLEVKMEKKVISLAQEEVAYVEARKGEKHLIKIQTRDNKLFFAPVQSMAVLLRDYFTGMMQVSRNYAVMPNAILGHSDPENKKLLLEVMHLDDPIEVSGVYYDSYANTIIEIVRNIRLSKEKKLSVAE